MRVIIIIACCISSAFAAENIVRDGTFNAGDIRSESEGNTPGVWAAYVIKDAAGSFAIDADGRSGNCVKYVKTGEGSHNFHLNQVIEVTPNTAYEMRAWMKSDVHLKPLISVSGMNWKPIATNVLKPSGEWQELRLLFNSGTNTRLRFEWFAGATGAMFTGIAGTSRLDDVAVTDLAGETLSLTARVAVNDIVKSGIPERPIGVSENVFNTSDRFYPERTISQAKTLALLGGRTVRGMEGNIGDFLIWSVPPYDKPAMRASAYHPKRVYMHQYFRPDGTLDRPMEFDEFIDTGIAAGVKEFFYIIGIDALNAIAGEWDYMLPDVTNAIIHAAEGQARYAKSRGVSMWFEIGNETDLNDYKEKKLVPWTAEGYIEALKLIAPAIKRGDRTAKVGVNAGFRENKEWLDRILPEAHEHIDFFIAHAYSPRGTYAMDRVNDAIARASIPEAVKARWTICLTETSSYNPGSPIRNDLAESTRNFVRMGVNRLLPRVTYMHFWTDRAADNDSMSGKNAFHPNGGLLPMGQVLSVWNEHGGERMLRTETEIPDMPVFATKKNNGTVNIFLANTVGVPVRYLLTIDNGRNEAAAFAWTGTGDDDTAPVWKQLGTVRAENGVFSVSIPGTGFVMLSFKQ
ncbi:MAG: hypothetical protein AABZ39_13990 [Spirochaetota bacterium]